MINRRREFVSGVLSLALAGFAGCADGGATPTPTDEPRTPPTGSPTPTGAQTETQSSTETTQAPETASPSDTASSTETPAQTESPTATPSQSTKSPSSDTPVDIEGSRFTPMRLSVPVGTRVEWTNRDSYSHDVTSAQLTDQGTAWDYYSGNMGEGAVAGYTFDTAGVYEYYCSIHGRSLMCGVVVVGDASHDATLPCE